MKFVKLQKASIKKQAALTDEQVNYLKQQFGDEMYKYDSFENHNDLNDAFSYEIEDNYNIDYTLDESDFQKVTGMSYQEYDKFLDEKTKQDISDDFEDAKKEDLWALQDILDSDKLELSWTIRKIEALIDELKQLKHTGDKSVGYRKDQVLDGKYQKLI